MFFKIVYRDMERYFLDKMKKPLAGLPHASPIRTIHLQFPGLLI